MDSDSEYNAVSRNEEGHSGKAGHLQVITGASTCYCETLGTDTRPLSVLQSLFFSKYKTDIKSEISDRDTQGRWFRGKSTSYTA